MKDYTPLFERFLEGDLKASGDWVNAFCPFHEQGGKANGHKTASFGFSPESGGWKCHGCNKSGNAIQFAGMLGVPGYDPLDRDSHQQAQELVNSILPWFDLKKKRTTSTKSSSDNAVGELPSREYLEELSGKLLSDQGAVDYLLLNRGWGTDQIKKMTIGLTEDRKHFTIPIFNEGEVVNVRYYSPKGKNPWNNANKIRGIKGRNEVRIYPDSVLSEEGDKVFLLEGEPDAIAGATIGLHCVTFTGGSGNVPKDLHRLREKEIILLYDNDKAGENGAKKVANALRKFTQRVKILDSEKALSGQKDLTDAILHAGAKETLSKVLEAEKETEFQVDNAVRRVPVREVSFEEAINSTNIGARIKIKAMVMGTRERPYAAFSRVSAECQNAGTKPMCSFCPLISGSSSFPQSEDGRLTEKEMLRQIRKSDVATQKELKKVCGFACDDFEVNSVRSRIESVYELVIGPYHEDSNSEESIGFQQRTVFSCNDGKQFRINQPYLFEGVTIPQPWDQANTHFFTNHEAIERSVDGFTLTEEEQKRLRVFQVTPTA